ncbi:hypothetical protein LEP1GSC170_4820 [Leptospira interrogans serovar Bataviae str. HAI135]|nr:hypothetical protein LEP1GSC170_4820 [Leptospira interrogans serovar Bataviae str. HAI135]
MVERKSSVGRSDDNKINELPKETKSVGTTANFRFIKKCGNYYKLFQKYLRITWVWCNAKAIEAWELKQNTLSNFRVSLLKLNTSLPECRFIESVA